MSKHQVKGPGHLGEIQRIDVQSRVSDLRLPPLPHEAPKLLLDRALVADPLNEQDRTQVDACGHPR
jgi:hypothetical protein